MRTQRVALVLSLFALGLAGCGGDDEDEDPITVPTVPLTVPGDETAGDDEATTGTTVDPAPQPPPAPAPVPAPPAPAPAPGLPPDSPENDTPPPQGSEAEQFERFCDENPGACP